MRFLWGWGHSTVQAYPFNYHDWNVMFLHALSALCLETEEIFEERFIIIIVSLCRQTSDEYSLSGWHKKNLFRWLKSSEPTWNQTSNQLLSGLLSEAWKLKNCIKKWNEWNCECIKDPKKLAGTARWQKLRRKFCVSLSFHWRRFSPGLSIIR